MKNVVLGEKLECLTVDVTVTFTILHTNTTWLQRVDIIRIFDSTQVSRWSSISSSNSIKNNNIIFAVILLRDKNSLA